MLWNLILAIAIAPVLSGVMKSQTQLCSSMYEYPCSDGACINIERLCDGVKDCADGSDETICVAGANTSLVLGAISSRGKRQSGCRRDQWQCRDGSCIPFYGKCDGISDCSDGSDETFPLCRNSACQVNLFRCTYGACVDGTAPCNGIQECADNSDELLPKCLNGTRVVKGRFKCDSGQEISVTELCDGVADCDDGSDEKIEACAGKTCPSFLFQCAYGACVDALSDCNGKQECADGSDESDELCNRTSTVVVTTPPTTTTTVGFSSGACVLPPYPANGKYLVEGRPFAKPGQRFSEVASVTVSCDINYEVDGSNSSILPCFGDTDLSRYIPQCKRYCALTPHHSVVYNCERRVGGAILNRPCTSKEFVGTQVVPTCRTPNYRGSPAYMHCTESGWTHIAKCSPGLVNNGTNITILIKDKVEVYINNLEYETQLVPNKDFLNQAKPVTPSIFDVDEIYWRFDDTNNENNKNTVTNDNDVKETINVSVKVENRKVKIKIGDTVLNIGN